MDVGLVFHQSPTLCNLKWPRVYITRQRLGVLGWSQKGNAQMLLHEVPKAVCVRVDAPGLLVNFPGARCGVPSDLLSLGGSSDWVRCPPTLPLRSFLPPPGALDCKVLRASA